MISVEFCFKDLGKGKGVMVLNPENRVGMNEYSYCEPLPCSKKQVVLNERTRYLEANALDIPHIFFHVFS